MAYLAPIHRPSSVRHAVKLNLLDRNSECLVLAKANRLEIWGLSSEGMVLLHSKAIYGRISMLSRIRVQGSRLDHLFVGTQRFHYFTIAWNSDTQTLETIQSFVDASEPHMRDSQSRDRCFVDPSGKFLVLELFEGVLNLVKIKKPRKGVSEYLDKAEQVRINELRVRDMCFLHTETNRPKIAFLYEHLDGDVRLASYRIVDEKMNFSGFDHTKDRENYMTNLDTGGSLLIPVPKGESESRRYLVRNASAAKTQLGGFVVVGEKRLTYMDDESNTFVELAMSEASIFVTWERLDDLRYFLADDYGDLHLLTILVEGGVDVTGLELRKLGRTTKATTMIHMGDGLMYIGSHEGDSQVVRVDLDAKNNGIAVLQTMDNIAPLLDFAIMDMGGRDTDGPSNEYSSGQARLVTGSGAYENGSLRSVRSGVGLEDIGILADMSDIRSVFALQSKSQCSPVDTLVVSLPTETRVFSFDPQGEIEELESFRGFSLEEQSLVVMSLRDGMLLQVTSTSVSIFSQGPKYMLARWLPERGQKITAADANHEHVLVCVDGTALVTLDITKNLRGIAVQNLTDDDQVACVHIPSQLSGVAVVGFWKSGSISILNLANLQIIHSEELRRTNTSSVPRDIALAQILPESTSGPTLFVALEDGIVLSFNVDPSTYKLYGRKSIVLGTQQAQFHLLPREDGMVNILATCEHPSLIYGAEGRIVYSAVTADAAISACSFNSEAYPDSIVLATSEHLKISQIDTERRTHVRTLPMGKTIRRVAYSKKERAFGIGAIERRRRQDEEIIESSFSLVEDVLFGQVGKPFILSDENGPELVECVTRAEIAVSHNPGEPLERFLVGTSYLDEDTAESDVRGRILVFGISREKTPYLIHSHVLKGACRQIAILDNKIVAALTKTVVMYSYTETTETEAALSKLASYRIATYPIDLDITGNIIAVADLMKSMSLLEYVKGENGLEDKLVEVAKHQQAVWSTGVVSLGDNQWLESDQDGNLLVLARNLDGLTESDRMKLDVTAEINMGDMVNKIRPIDVEASPNALVVPKAFLATTEGSIYLFSLIVPSSVTLLTSLQTRLSSHPALATLGNLEFDSYRGYKTSERESAEPYRFVDGELIERFLDLDEEVQREVCEGLGPSVEDVRGVVEELKRLH